MKMVLYIAKREIKKEFFSFKGYCVIFFFLAFLGVFFHSYLDNFILATKNAQEVGGLAPEMSEFFNALFSVLQFILLLIIPAVTMTSYTDEKKNNLMKVILSSPVKSYELVLGKLLASFCVLLLAVVCSFVYPLYFYMHADFQISLVFSCYLGLVLLILAQLSFGHWVASMCSGAFFAFLFTMFGLFSLLILNTIVSALRGSGFIVDTFRYLGITDHYVQFSRGLITVSDISYFLLFTTTFVFFTIHVIDSMRLK